MSKRRYTNMVALLPVIEGMWRQQCSIAHDLSMVEYLCDRVEVAPAKELFIQVGIRPEHAIPAKKQKRSSGFPWGSVILLGIMVLTV